MDVVLIANGMTNRGEHSYRLVQEVRGALSKRAIGCHTYAARSLDPSVIDEKIAIPHFEYTLYDSIGPRVSDPLVRNVERCWKGGSRFLSYPAEFLSWQVLNRSFYRDLACLPRDLLKANNLLVITAICQNQISGLIDFMTAQARNLLPNVICHLMFPPSWTPWERAAQFGDVYYRKAFAKATPFTGQKLFFTTENDAIAKIYREEFGVETKILPVPLAVSPRPRCSKEVISLGFFGYSKSAKGFHLLPEAAAICRDEGLNVEFRIQIQHSQWEQATVAAERKLRTMPNVSLIEGVLNSVAYIRETNNADIILLPYDPGQFGMRGSGMFTQAVSAGQPIIASQGTFAAESIRKGEAQGEIFAPYTAKELAGAITRILSKIDEMRSRAETQATAFARKHNGDAYVDALLSLAGAA